MSRPHPDLTTPLLPPQMSKFLSTAKFANLRVLGLGEQDYSISLAIAQDQSKKVQLVQLVATSYLRRHSSNEPEIHVKDDDSEADYSRNSLPSMRRQLQVYTSRVMC